MITLGNGTMRNGFGDVRTPIAVGAVGAFLLCRVVCKSGIRQRADVFMDLDFLREFYVKI